MYMHLDCCAERIQPLQHHAFCESYLQFQSCEINVMPIKLGEKFAHGVRKLLKPVCKLPGRQRRGSFYSNEHICGTAANSGFTL